MSEDQKPSRRPFGERSEEERQLPFGERAPRRQPPDSDGEEEEPPRRPSHFSSFMYAVPQPSEPAVEETPAYDRPSEDAYDLPADDPYTDDDLDFELPDLDDILVDQPAPDQVESEDLLEYDEPYSLPDLDELGLDEDRFVERTRDDVPDEDEPEPEETGTDRRSHRPGFWVAQPAARAPAVEEPPPVQTGIRLGLVLQTFGVIIMTGIGLATLFTWWTPDSFLPPESADRLAIALATQAGVEGLPTTPVATSEAAPVATAEAPQFAEVPSVQNVIGIVSGHRGPNRSTGLPDPGAVCADGLTEREVNERVALQVVELLQGEGYQVDLLDEFDSRLTDYQALALVSIHADSCEYVNEYATGFKVASLVATESATAEQDQQLVRCLIDNYTEATGLSFHPSVTYDMADYHTFWEIAPGTPGAIIEIGFMYLDRDMLTNHSDLIALGIARGVLCYARSDIAGGAQPQEEN